jgi:acyl phosphate:glycerol-3-phosphate acyltransferase
MCNGGEWNIIFPIRSVVEAGMVIKIILALVIAYLLGSIPFAFLVAYLKKKIDIRRVGTGNVGTMNVARELGVVPGFVVLGLDMAKAVLAVFVAKWLGLSLWWVFLVGFAVIVGHSWPVFLKFKGGRGLGPALGVLLALTPLEFVFIFVLLLLIFFLTRNSGLSAGIAILVLPLVIWAFGEEVRLIFYPLVLGIFTGLRSVLALKPNHVKANLDSNPAFRIYPKFWRKPK